MSPHTPTDHPFASPQATGQSQSPPQTTFTQPIDRRLALVVFLLQLTVMTIISVNIVVSKGPPWIIALLLTVLIVSTWVFLMMRITVRLEPDQLRFAFVPLWKGRLNYNEIESVEVVKLNPITQFGGWGVKHRMGFRKPRPMPKSNKGISVDTGYIAKGGPAVRIDRANKGSIYITMDNAEELAIAILERITPTDDDSK